MRRPLLVFLGGLTVACLAFWLVYLFATATQRELSSIQQGELRWLQREFNLSDLEYVRIKELHDGYLPKCEQRCREMEALNERLRQSLASASEITAQTDALLAERGHMIAECQREMLSHFFKVSQAMPAEQGKRYLAWVHEHTCLRAPMVVSDPAHRGAHTAHF